MKVIFSSLAFLNLLQNIDNGYQEHNVEVYCENNKFGIYYNDELISKKTLDVESKFAFNSSVPFTTIKKLISILKLLSEQPIVLEFTDYEWIYIKEAIL